MVKRGKTSSKVAWMTWLAILLLIVAVVTYTMSQSQIREKFFNTPAMTFSTSALTPSNEYPVVLYQRQNYTGYSMGFKYGRHMGTDMIAVSKDPRSLGFASCRLMDGFNMYLDNVVGNKPDVDMKISGAFASSIRIHSRDTVTVSWNPVIIGAPVAVMPRRSDGNTGILNYRGFNITANGRVYDDPAAEVVWRPDGFVANGVSLCRVPAWESVVIRKFLPNTTGAPINAIVLLKADDYGVFKLEYMDKTRSALSELTRVDGQHVNFITIPVGGAVIMIQGTNKGDAGCAGIRASIMRVDNNAVIARTDASWIYTEGIHPR